MEVDWLISRLETSGQSTVGQGKERVREREKRREEGDWANWEMLSFEFNSNAEGCWIIWIGQCVEINRAKCRKWIWKGDQEIKRGREGEGRIETIWKRWSRNGQGWGRDGGKKRAREEERVVSVCMPFWHSTCKPTRRHSNGRGTSWGNRKFKAEEEKDCKANCIVNWKLLTDASKKTDWQRHTLQCSITTTKKPYAEYAELTATFKCKWRGNGSAKPFVAFFDGHILHWTRTSYLEENK